MDALTREGRSTWAPLAAVTDRDTYRGLLFLGSGLVFGTLGFVALAAAWSVTLALAITPLVIFVVIGFGVAVNLVARGESALVRQLLGVDCYPDRHRGGLGAHHLRPLRRARTVVTDPAFWKVQGYLLLRFVVGVPLALVELSLIGAGLFLLTSSVHHGWIPQDDGAHGIDMGIWLVDTVAEALLLFPVGLVLLVLAANLVRPLTAPWRRFTYRLLGGTMTDDHLPFDAAQMQRGLLVHSIVVGGISALLVIIWVLTTRSYFWPMWPVLALSLPLAINTWVTLVQTRPQIVPPRLGRAFALHAGVSAAIGAFLSLIWVFVSTTAGLGYFWPIWPILGLTVPVLIHLVVRLLQPPDAELQRRIDVLTTTRAGAVDAQEQELRRIERDLHDGAQARLVALGMNLGMAEQKLASDPERVRQLLVEAREGAREALEELRDLARGIHPPILADRGLGAAVSALAARSPVRVNVTVEGERPPPAVESAAYFVAAEALANAGKHAQAGRVDVRIERSQGQLVVEVTDDGRGGANPEGSGLVGLRRRVEALDGRLTVMSPEGGPTTVHAELPCE